MDIQPVEYIAQTLALKENIEQGFIVLGERLYTIKRDELWRGSYDSYQEFLFDMRISEGTDSKLRAIYQRFILQYHLPVEKIARVGWSSAYQIVSKITDKQKAIDLIDKAQDLRREDVAAEIAIHIHGEHECNGEEMKFVKCAVCKRLTRIG